MDLDFRKFKITPLLFLWTALSNPHVDFGFLTEWIPFLRRHIRYYNEIVNLNYDDLQKLAHFSNGNYGLKPLNSIILLDNDQTDVSYLIGSPDVNGVVFVNEQTRADGGSAYLAQESVKMLLFELIPGSKTYKIYFTKAIKPAITVRGDPRNNDLPVHYEAEFVRNSNGDKVHYMDPTMNFVEILPGQSIYSHYPHLDTSLLHPDKLKRLHVPVQPPFQLVHHLILEEMTNSIIYPLEKHRSIVERDNFKLYFIMAALEFSFETIHYLKLQIKNIVDFSIKLQQKHFSYSIGLRAFLYGNQIFYDFGLIDQYVYEQIHIHCTLIRRVQAKIPILLKMLASKEMPKTHAELGLLNKFYRDALVIGKEISKDWIGDTTKRVKIEADFANSIVDKYPILIKNPDKFYSYDDIITKARSLKSIIEGSDYSTLSPINNVNVPPTKAKTYFFNNSQVLFPAFQDFIDKEIEYDTIQIMDGKATYRDQDTDDYKCFLCNRKISANAADGVEKENHWLQYHFSEREFEYTGMNQDQQGYEKAAVLSKSKIPVLNRNIGRGRGRGTGTKIQQQEKQVQFANTYGQGTSGQGTSGQRTTTSIKQQKQPNYTRPTASSSAKSQQQAKPISKAKSMPTLFKRGPK